jgi:hypothetical protein
MISALKTFWSFFTIFCSLLSKGSTYAAVFPVPDFDAPSTSTPLSAKGTTLFCMAVVCSYFACAMAFRISGCKFSFSNALMVVPLMQTLFEPSPKNYVNAVLFYDSAFSASLALHFNACQQAVHTTYRMIFFILCVL